VIRAFNENLPFDRFTVEQLAGDLLPEPTVAQRVASAYNKLNLTTEEGGAQPKEYEIRSFADRVRSVSSVWLGATMGCCECHDHKYDPYATKDFYSMAAFFADIQEAAIMDRDAGTAEAEIARLKRALEASTPELEAAQAEWERGVADAKPPKLGPWWAVGPFMASTPQNAFKTPYPPEKEREFDPKREYRKERLKWIEHPEWVDGEVHALSGENAATYLTRTIEAEAAGAIDLSLGSDDGIKVWIDGKELLAKEVYRGVAADQERVTVPLRAGSNRLLMKIHNGAQGYGFTFRVASAGASAEIVALARKAREERTDPERNKLATYYRTIAPLLDPVRADLAAAQQKYEAVTAKMTRCLVTVSGKPREVKLRPRGNWMDESGPVLGPAIPSFLGTLPIADRRPTRLDLARWIVSKENALTARVFVNRLWALFYGVGLSKRLDDLGAQGEWPVHPELLDWLAVEFVESGWDVKRLVRLMTTSAAYRQSSKGAAELRARDPENRLVARQSRWRLDAELVRDDALAVSGLLVRTIGGPSVKPYQPKGYWMHLNFPKREWDDAAGEDQYRRGLYTWWQRSFHHPSMMAFDAPSREDCCAERVRSNIPQQALVLLNDPTYVEAARALAERIVREGGAGVQERAVWAFRRVLSRRPAADETAVLTGLYARHAEQYRKEPESAAKLAAAGQAPAAKELDAVEVAAWTSVARTLLNLHEAITRN
jgi:hypothetical protein